MPCDGYEHGNRVSALIDFPELKILKGMTGVIVSINRREHLLDIDFPQIGKLTRLPADKFKLAPPSEAEAEF